MATVLVSPDGALGLVPLAALPGKAAGSYLIEDYTIALVPVPRMFGADEAVAADGPKPATAQAEAPSLLLVGDVDYGGDPGAAPTAVASRSAAVGTRAGLLPDFTKLSATGDEIAAIGRYFKHHFRGAQPDELSRRPGDRGGAARGGLEASLPAPGHARLLRPAGTPLGAGAERPRRRGRGRTSSALGESPGSIRGCSRAWRWPAPTSGPPRSGRMTAS